MLSDVFDALRRCIVCRFRLKFAMAHNKPQPSKAIAQISATPPARAILLTFPLQTRLLIFELGSAWPLLFYLAFNNNLKLPYGDQ